MGFPGRLLYDDSALIAVDKPTGIPVVPARGGPAADSLRHRLESALGTRLWVVHRIDQGASGVVVLARTAEAHRCLSLAFERRQVQKAYCVFVQGRSAESSGHVDVPLHDARRGKTRPAQPDEPGRREAVTDFTVERRWQRMGGWVSRLEARPLTGRRHQIRVHLRWLRLPILFDPLYGSGTEGGQLAEAPARRLALHARRLVVPNPSGDGTLAFEAPLAPDLEELQSWLERNWEGSA
jgi:tRNA pseudouridine32 synthase/23S rRNA pseudouridine746 synthase